jgi:hypothetical protein
VESFLSHNHLRHIQQDAQSAITSALRKEENPYAKLSLPNGRNSYAGAEVSVG